MHYAAVQGHHSFGVNASSGLPLPFQTIVHNMQEQEEFDAASLGKWAWAGKDKWLWSLTLRSPGALSQMILFRQALQFSNA